MCCPYKLLIRASYHNDPISTERMGDKGGIGKGDMWRNQTEAVLSAVGYSSEIKRRDDTFGIIAGSRLLLIESLPN